MSRIIVTGSAGFIGWQVVAQLTVDGHQVIGFDLPDDFTKPNHFSAKLDEKEPEAVVHIGAMGDVYECERLQCSAFDTNAAGTHRVAFASRKHNVPLICCSTWEVYGSTGTLTEETPPTPEGPYACSKYAGEIAAQSTGVDMITLRLGSAYGPGMRESQVIKKFIRLGKSGQGITVDGDGSQFRQWLHVADCRRAFSLAVKAALAGEHIGEAFNIVSEEKTSIKQIAELVSERYGVAVTHGEPRPGDVASAVVSGKKAGESLGWQASVSFADGMGRLFELEGPV